MVSSGAQQSNERQYEEEYTTSDDSADYCDIGHLTGRAAIGRHSDQYEGDELSVALEQNIRTLELKNSYTGLRCRGC